jgi:hypothetical protein
MGDCLPWATFLCYFFLSMDYELILSKNVLGYLLGDFFTNSSDHPVGDKKKDLGKPWWRALVVSSPPAEIMSREIESHRANVEW